ncbi:hypothetical protein BEWA_003110 [Theileria equi strain WA]|uniref:Uncharacterized protein n=1 Tax=Theileria equi strain WA TaxID=1537102 RepID=L0B099_THEEQ|nr:hypothetical protein BEWA_003110 [Theileria equi strain WA]AFZ80903.1 hypothetical protein BEWA_003110 [Theileria equi strain WA]|eukprot:XP_004830569.1 hypothetical protein BEWA_003110 [Theileria equi strain WA]
MATNRRIHERNVADRLDVCLAGVKYCENADRDLKLLLLEAHDGLNKAKEACTAKEHEAGKLSAKYNTSKLSKLTQIAKEIVENNSNIANKYKQEEIKAAIDIFVPYVQAIKLVEQMEKNYNLVYERILINEEIYRLYKEDESKLESELN